MPDTNLVAQRRTPFSLWYRWNTLCWQRRPTSYVMIGPTDIFINQRTECYLNNTINLRTLTPHIMPCYRLPTKWRSYRVHVVLTCTTGSRPITFLWLWSATDHEPHCRHVSINELWRWTESTPRSGWRSHMAGIYSTREIIIGLIARSQALSIFVCYSIASYSSARNRLVCWHCF